MNMLESNILKSNILKLNILELVKDCRLIGISGHENPDGDCVGSCCAMAMYLRKAMPDAEIRVYLEEFDEALVRCIPGAESVRHDLPESGEVFDAFIALDSTPDRMGPVSHFFDSASVKINIDHHVTNSGCGTYNYINGKASSACELVYELMDPDQIDAGIAQALYTGIVTDTGVFQYPSTGEKTMCAAGHLMRYGFDFSSIIREVFFERTPVNARMLGTALLKSQFLEDGRFMLCVLNREDMAAYGAGRRDLDGISAQMVLTKGVDCAVFVHEDETGVWRASMRSIGIVDVARTASLLGGGGHVRAAGCTIRTSITEALGILKKDIEEQLRSADGHELR